MTTTAAESAQTKAVPRRRAAALPMTTIRSMRISAALLPVLWPLLHICSPALVLSETGEATKTCKRDEFRCETTRMCIPDRLVCNGQHDCSDGSDETPDACFGRTCDSVNQFQCNSGQCIPRKWECDHENDCRDGSDEGENCNVTCPEETFRCATGKHCVPRLWMCDGYADCFDHSDEANCSSITFATNQTEFFCQPNEFRCGEGTCVHQDFVCDGDVDCPDESDEANCDRNCTDFLCRSDGECVSWESRCDGVPDCADGSDEEDCNAEATTTKSCDAKNQFDCGDGSCVPWEKLCDGKADCFGATPADESPALNCSQEIEDLCRSHVCDQICLNTILGPKCSCAAGYQVSPSNKSKCIDTDECQQSGTCSQICINTKGSFQCKCHRGYTLQFDGRTCRAAGDHAKLLVGSGHDISAVDLVTLNVTTLLSDLGTVGALDYAYKSRQIFWSDYFKTQILSRTLIDDLSAPSGGDKAAVVSDNQSTVDAIAVDWAHELLYWTDSESPTISVVQFNGEHRRTLFSKNLNKPLAIAVDPLRGVMFWSDWGRFPKIERAGMDGTHRQVIISAKHGHWPKGIALDLEEQRLFWADAKWKKIFRAEYFGEHKTVVFSNDAKLFYPVYIAVFEENIYWSDADTRSIHRVNVLTGKTNRLLSELTGIANIRVAHPIVQPKITNNCSAKSCSHLCVPAFNLVNDSSPHLLRSHYPYSCICADGFRLGSDGRSCIPTGSVPSSQADNTSTIIARVLGILLAVGVCAGLVCWLFLRRKRHLSLNRNRHCPTGRHNGDVDESHSLQLQLTSDEEFRGGTGVYQPTVMKKPTATGAFL